MKGSGSCNAIGHSTTECRCGGWKVLSIGNALGQLPGGQLGADRLDARFCQTARELRASWPKEGGVCLCNRTPDAAADPRGCPPALVDPRVSLGPAPEGRKPTPHQENANETNHQIMGNQTPAPV